MSYLLMEEGLQEQSTKNQYSFSITQMWNGGEAERTHFNGLIWHLVFTQMPFSLSLPSLQV